MGGDVIPEPETTVGLSETSQTAGMWLRRATLAGFALAVLASMSDVDLTILEADGKLSFFTSESAESGAPEPPPAG
jgi:hypothetical protein